MSTSATAASTPELSSISRVIVGPKDTVAALDSSMPPVAATPYLVTIAEAASYRLVQNLREPGQITVGSRVVIDHLGPSKVGAELVVKAALVKREKTVSSSWSASRTARAPSQRSSTSAQQSRCRK